MAGIPSRNSVAEDVVPNEIRRLIDAALHGTRPGDHERDVAGSGQCHGRSSKWAYYVVEEEKVRLSWSALERIRVTRREEYSAEHRLEDHAFVST
jgi:hypothetical protein